MSGVVRDNWLQVALFLGCVGGLALVAGVVWMRQAATRRRKGNFKLRIIRKINEELDR